MARYLAFFGRSLAVVSIILAACSSDSSSSSSSGGTTGAEAGVDGSSSGGPDGGGDAKEPIDAGPKPYGNIPNAPPTTYTCNTEIHVATTGDDGTGDGTVAKPYKTIAKGLSLATAQDTCVQVHAGTYAAGATLTFPNDGLSGHPIVLRSADGKGTAILDGSAAAAPIIEVNKDYVVIDGFEFKNTPTTGGVFDVRFDGTLAGKCNGSVLRNSKLAGGFSSLKVYQKTQGVVIEDNEFLGTNGNSTASLTGASGMTFRANYIHDLNTGDLGTIELAGGSTSVLFEKNLFQDITSSAGALVLGDNCNSAACTNDPDNYAAVNAVARNNIMIRVNRGMDILGCKNCSVLANTIVDGGAATGYVFKIGSAGTGPQSVVQPTVNLRIVDNLLSSPGGVMGYVMDLSPSSTVGTMDYNLFYNNSNGVAFGQTHPASADTHSVNGKDPLLGTMDQKPGAGSPAIGVGTSLGTDVPDDFLSVARPATPDIGAVQH